MSRICKCCFRELEDNDFYKYGSGNPDSVCKECRKRKIHENYLIKSQDPSFIEKERERGREKYNRLGYKNKKSDKRIKKAAKYTSLRNARRDFNVSISRDIELHHWNYNRTDSVIELNRKLHRRLHNSISLNIDEGIYYYGNEKLDTLQKHLDVIKHVCLDNEFDFSEVNVLTKC